MGGALSEGRGCSAVVRSEIEKIV